MKVVSQGLASVLFGCIIRTNSTSSASIFYSSLHNKFFDVARRCVPGQE
jgi:hypothetical protein